jgi:hypothetical protein
MCGDAVVQPFVVIDEALTMIIMRLVIGGIRLQAFARRQQIPVFAEQ